MATTLRPNGIWAVDFRYRGLRIRKNSPVQTRRGAEAYERLLRRELLAQDVGHGTVKLGPPVSFTAFMSRWLENVARPQNRPSTFVGKQGVVRKHLVPAFGTLLLRDVTSERVAMLIKKMHASGLSPKSIANTTSILRSALTTAYRHGEIRAVPFIPTTKVAEPVHRFLRLEECRALVEAAPPPYWRTLVLFFLQTGCRFGEGAALRWDALDLRGPAPYVRVNQSAWRGIPGPTKNGKCRILPLSPEVAVELRSLQARSSSEYVFALRNGALPTSGGARKYLHRIADKAGVRGVSWHVLRHTFATELSERGVPIRVIQELLGHSSIAITARYTHLGDQSLQTAITELPRLRPTSATVSRELEAA